MKTMKPGTRWMLVGSLGAISAFKDDEILPGIVWGGGVMPPLFGTEESMRDIQGKIFKLSGERLKLVNVPDDWQFKPEESIL